MQLIQWYPGHMAKAVRMMEENLKYVDAVAVILDARCYKSSINRTFLKLLENKKVLYVLNKSDLIDQKDISRIIQNFKSEQKQAISIVGTDKKSVNNMVKAINLMLADKIEKNKQKGVVKPLRVMVCGIPNTGKSTIINTICGRKKAETGDKAGVTKSKQWIKLQGLELLDTPGTMPPSFENQQEAKHLAYVGSINDDILSIEDLTLEFIQEIVERYPQFIQEKYKLQSIAETPLQVFEDICKNRGYIIKGGEYDYTRGSKAILCDFRAGKIGKICLD